MFRLRYVIFRLVHICENPDKELFVVWVIKNVLVYYFSSAAN